VDLIWGALNTALNEKANSINVYTKTQSDTNFQRKLVNSTINTGETSFVFLNINTVRSLRVSEPVQMLFDDNRITSVASGGSVSLDNYYTKSQIDTSLTAKQNV